MRNVTKYIEQSLVRSPPAKKRQMEPEQKKMVFFRKKWHHGVPWLETNDKRNEMCAHVRCAAHTHWRTAQNQLIATFLLSDNQMLRGRVAAVRLKKKS